MLTPARQLVTGLGAGAGLFAALALALTTWARCTDLGEPVQVLPSIRDGGLTRRDR